MLNEELSEARWIDPAELADLSTTPGLAEIVAKDPDAIEDGWLIVPHRLGKYWRIAPGDNLVYMGRRYGAFMLGLVAAMWMARDYALQRQAFVEEGEARIDEIEHAAVFLHDGFEEGERLALHVLAQFGRGDVHAERGVDENLNAPGASFVPLAFEQSAHTPQPGMKPGASTPNRFYMYGVVARLAMLAASYELEATDPEAETLD